MSFIWPAGLVSLLLVPLLVAGYTSLAGRRQARLAALGTVAGASAARPPDGWRKHISPVILLIGITLLLTALARPTVAVALPHQEGTVILAFDASSSMLAEDLQPSRMDAAKKAAAAFVEDQPSTIQVGVVAFSLGGLVVQKPTNVKADVLAAVDRLTPEGGTSLGEGIFASLRAIADKPIVLDEAAAAGDIQNVDIGYYGSAVIVLLSDGEDTSRVDPVAMAQLAANAGVRIYPVGIGSEDGTTIEIDGYRVATSLNEDQLKDIATVTGGTYSRASNETELGNIYEKIDLRLSIEGEDVEITALIAGAALCLFVVGGLLSMFWFGRLP